MPFIDDTEILARAPEGVEPPRPRTPGVFQTFEAAFRQDNTVFNLARKMFAETFPPVPGYDPMDDLRGTKYEALHLNRFIDVQSPSETRQRMAQTDVEDDDREIGNASGFAGFVAQVVASNADPLLALPGSIAVRSTKGGYSVSRSALAVGAAAAGQTAAQEAVLQATQETRTAEESVGAVASAAILGGILGAGATALLTRAERNSLERALDVDRLAIDAHATQAAPTPAAAGAAATDVRQMEMFKTPLDRLGLDNLSVTRRTLQAEAVEARRVMADLAETPYRFTEGDQGIAATQGPALDRLARMEMNGTRVAVADELDQLFSDYRFGQPDRTMPRLRSRIEDFTGSGEGKMGFTDFKKEVSIALQSGDQHAIPQVAQAAQFIRSKLLAPWADRAETAIEGFSKIEPAAGEGYFPHVWNKEIIRARRPEFTNQLVDLYTADQTTKRGIQERLSKLSDDLSELRDRVEKAKTPEARVEASIRYDEIREKIEAELGRWDGKSASEAKSALKARIAADAARSPEAKAKKPRLESADDAIDKAVKKILESDRDLPVDELRARASQTVDRIIGSPDGRLAYDIASGGPRIGHQREPMPRGALAGRSLNVSNAWAREWIENDVEQVVAMHLRTVVPDVLLSERFGDVEMTQSFRKIEDAYSALIDATRSEKERVRLGKERDAVIRDVAAVRDRVRGVYGWSPELANMARVANSAKVINNLTSMGSVALSSLPDMAGTLIRWGVVNGIRDGWAPFFRGLTSSTEEWGKFKTQMRAIGIGVETAINARQHSLDDVVDVYRPQSRVERTLQGASDKFFIANLLAPLTDAQKLIASHAAVSEIIRAARAVVEGKATKRQIGNLAESGIDTQMAGRIWREFGELKRGEITDGVHLPNTADWKDRAAADALNGAVAREVDIAVVTPGQEKPLWMSKPVVSLLGQFKAFTAASTERILVANLQRRDAAALSGIIFSVGMGMLTYKLNSFFGGTKTSDRPQDWFKEGISRGGLLGWFEESNALASKMTRGSADIYRLIGADKPLSRFASRAAVDMLLGPTAGKLNDITKITGAASSGDWGESDTTATRRLIAGQNLFWLRGALNKVEAEVNQRLGVEMKDKP